MSGRQGGATGTTTLFETAAQHFDGWQDPDTGLAVLRIDPDLPLHPEGGPGDRFWSTTYHQYNPFYRDGCSFLLRNRAPGKRGGGIHLLDLTTGTLSRPWPDQTSPASCPLDSDIFLLFDHRDKDAPCMTLMDIGTGEEFVSFAPSPDHHISAYMQLIGDSRLAIVGEKTGEYARTGALEACENWIYLLSADEAEPRLIAHEEGVFLNHYVGNPVRPEVVSFNRWPTPARPVEVAHHLRDVAGTWEKPLPQIPGTVRPGTLYGGQRDHFVWMPEGRRIASYFSSLNGEIKPGFNHFQFDWHLSVMDWETGEDLSAAYPEDRWGCHFNPTPDGQFLVSGSGQGLNELYAIEVEGLRRGWNERVLCTYPETLSKGDNDDPFHHPHVLPDGSGVLFTAGWPDSSNCGVYLCEWPKGW
ncbi:MAG: TolB-like translocation protein [Planctomycetota bacterium]|jgi:hypothetical protein